MTQATPDNHATGLPRLGHYHLLESIGRGGMGLVYRARDTRLERDVAVKCLRTELFEDHYIERFKREALLLAKLNHPNIVQIYDFIAAPDQVALVMELVDGQNLHTYLREHIVPISQRLQWLTQITEGLAVAHDAGIIHRDLKTENILINKRGQAKITDLGIAKSQDFNATLTDHVAGSYCSMSPEQAMGETITFKSDLFSLGILAYQLLCGAHPFGDTSNKLQTMQRIISHPPTAPQQHNPNLPGEFIDLLGQLLSKDPDKRPDNTHWVAGQFAKFKELNWQEDLSGDDTQALAIPLPVNTKLTRTQDHPTFDTRFVAVATSSKVSIWKNIKHHLVTNKIAVSSAVVSILIIAGIAIWQLQPKPPKYVAVIPPKLIAEGMQESQQELVKGAVYDAIQQSVIQLDGYYLIPHSEIVDINGDNETVRLATGADELITSEVQCKIETCTIILTRLAPEKNSSQSRLRVENTKTVDALTDNYLSMAGTIQSTIKSIYPHASHIQSTLFNQEEYKAFLNQNKIYLEKGASEKSLHSIELFPNSIKTLPAVQTLYRSISLDLYHETKNKVFLEKLESFLKPDTTPTGELTYLYNLTHLLIAKHAFNEANSTIKKLQSLNSSASLAYELQAHAMMEQNNYASAAENYKKAINSKRTASNLINLSNAYWYHGNTLLAQQLLQEAIQLSPNHYKAHGLLGLIKLYEGKPDQAAASFEKVISFKPDDITNLSNLGLCYLLLKDYAKSIQLFNQASSLAPQLKTLTLNIADTENLAGNIEKSHLIYNQIIETSDAEDISAENYRNIAQAYAHIGQEANALRALQKLEQTAPQNIETTYTAALVHALISNNTAAIFNIENSLKSGMNVVWFSFSWFDSLCQHKEFYDLMKSYGEPSRCTLQ